MTRTRRSKAARSVIMIAIATAILPASIACAAAIDSRLTGRLDPETAAAVGAIVDTARSKGLPTDPLVARALEGASRHAPGPRIVAAVSGLSEALEASREALGPASSDAELIAGATALAAGVSADTLVSLRTARRKASLLVPLVVLTDLVTRGVPVETASSAVVAASRTRARDADLMRLRQRIDQDIRAGAPPGSATIQRTRKLIGSLQGSIAPQVSPGRPPSPGP